MQEAVLTQKRKSVLSNPNFLLLFLGGLVSRIGNGIHYIGLVWYILEMKGSGFAVGFVLMISTLPGVLLGPFSGVLVDRFDRKKIIIWMDIVRGVIVIIMGLMILNHTLNFGLLMLATVLLSICGTFFNPAVSASIPNIVSEEQLTQANSLEHISMNLTGMIGPALGGILIAVLGVAGVFVINGISFLLSALSEVFIQIPSLTSSKNGKKIELFKEIKEGASFIYREKTLFYTLFACLFANFLYAGSFSVGLPIIVRNVLGGNVQEFGIFEAAWPIGAVLGGLILSKLPEFKKVYKVFVNSLAIQTFFVTIIGFITLPTFTSALGVTLTKNLIIALLVIGGFFNAMVNIPILVVLQRMIPDELRGRIFALTGTVSQGLVPISIGIVGLIVDLISPAYLFIITGFGMAIVIIDFMRRKEVRDM